MLKTVLLFALASSLAACSLFEGQPEYSGPSDYAYTLSVGCFCLVTGPLRITVQGGVVTRVEELSVRESDDPVVDDILAERSITLVELGALVRRARLTADAVEVEYDPTYGFPASVSIDYERNATDDEIRYTVTDYTPL